MDYYYDTLKKVLDVVLSGCSFISLDSVELTDSSRHLYTAVFNVKADLIDDDFEPDFLDESSCLKFTQELVSYRACQILFAYLVDNNKVDFLGVKSIQVPSGTDRIERRDVLRFFLKPIDGHHFFYNQVSIFNVWNRDDLGFETGDAIYDEEPTIETHYSPASFDKTQGEPGGWSPESYEYECSPSSVVIPVFVDFEIGFDHL